MYDIKNSVDSGRVIAVWSPVHRQGAISTTTALLAAYMAERINVDKTDDKVLILSNELYGAYTAADYLNRDTMPDGLTEVVELASSDNLKSYVEIYNNTYSGLKNVDILYGSKRNTNIEDFITREIPKIFEIARTGYKYILVDAVAGGWDETTRAILRHCDIIIVCMPQDRKVFENWVRKIKGTYVSYVEEKPTLVVSTQHVEYKHMSYEKMRRELKGELYYICLNDVVHRAVYDRDIYDTIKKEMRSKKPDEVIEELENIYNRINKAIEQVVSGEIRKEMEAKEEHERKINESMKDMFMDGFYEDDTDEEEQDAGADLFETSDDEDSTEGVMETNEDESESTNDMADLFYGG